jgi:hypothetical protein
MTVNINKFLSSRVNRRIVLSIMYRNVSKAAYGNVYQDHQEFGDH